MARGKKRRPPHSRDRKSAATRPETDPFAEIRAALDHEHPHTLLSMVAAILASLDPPTSPFEPAAVEPGPTVDQLVTSFLDVEARETTGFLTAVAALTTDDLLRARINRELAGRPHILPSWLQRLDHTEAVGLSEMVHALGDGDDIMIELALPGGAALTVVIYIDHNLGTVVKDAFAVPARLAEVTKLIGENTDEDTTVRPLSPADARVRITEALDLGRRMYPPLESDTWPLCRPLVEWATRMLPTGGTGYARPEWAPAERDRLEQRFLESSYAAALVDSLIRFGTDYGPGDPLRWSPVTVEILLVDWIPRKIIAEVAYLAKAPDLLRAFIRFSHAERGIKPALTTETLAAVDTYDAEYQRLIRSPRPQGPAALLAGMGLFDAGEPLSLDEELAELMTGMLSRTVGGEQALRDLTADPLPDEPFDWTGIPADVRERLADVLAVLDEGCVALFDREFRTACRRFLADAAAGDPSVVRRRAGVANTAAAVCWAVGHANKLLTYDGGLLVRDLRAHFGASSSVSQRAGALIEATGASYDAIGPVQLGTARYLLARERRDIIAQRDRHLAMRE